MGRHNPKDEYCDQVADLKDWRNELQAQVARLEGERDEARLQRNILGGVKAISQRWLVRGRHLLTHQQKQTRVAVRQAAKFQAEAAALQAANTVKRDALRLAQHKIEQTPEGQYPEGQALNAALFAIRAALSDTQTGTAGEGKRQPALFQQGLFNLHSGGQTIWKIDCDALSEDDLATVASILSERIGRYGSVEGVSSGGLRLAEAFRMYQTAGPLLIVDDVLTTGTSMEEQQAGREAIGAVIFARGRCPPWVTPLFTLGEGWPEVREQARRAMEVARSWIDATAGDDVGGNSIVEELTAALAALEVT